MFTKYTTRTSTLKATTADIRTLNVGTIDIANIQADSISADSGSFEKFEAGNITASDLSSDTIEAKSLESDSINTTELVSETISAAELTGETVSATELVGNTITGESISSGTLSSETINATGSISAKNLTSESVVATGNITAKGVVSETTDAGELVAKSIGIKDDEGNVQDLNELIEAVAETAAVDIGDKTKDELYLNVSNLVFKGSYVNVVKDPNSSKVTLWINKSTAFPNLKDISPLAGAPVSSKSAKIYSDVTDNFALPVTSGETFNEITEIVENGAAFTKIDMSLRNSEGNLTFTSDKNNNFWARIVYNGVAGSWVQIPFNVNAGTFDINKAYENNTSPSPFTGTKSSKSDGSGLKVSYFVRHFDDNDAEYGRVPGQSEAEIEIELDMETILVKDGGTVRFDWFISSDTPSTFNSVNMFFTEYKKPSLTFASAVYVSKISSSKVSGLSYNTAGSTATVTISGIKNTQWKASNNDNIRLKIAAAGNSSNIVIGDDGISVTGTGSAAEFAYSGTVELGSVGSGTASISVTPVGYVDGTAASKTLSTYWGSIPTSTAMKENFGNESYRMLTPTSVPGSYPSAEDATTHKITGINNTNTEHCSAVCQYGSLYHPASTAADASGKQYSRTESRPAVFIRTFTGTANNKFKLSASNLIQKDKVQIWWKDGNNWYDLSTPVAGSVEHSNTSTTDTVTKIILPEAGETKRGDMTIAIVLQPGASAIGQINASFSA